MIISSRIKKKISPVGHGKVTVRTSIGLVTPADAAVILVVPTASVVATPLLSIVATVLSLETHAATPVISTVPRHVVAVAVNG